MANWLMRDFVRVVASRWRWIFSAACVATLASCGGGRNEVVGGFNTNEASAGTSNPSDVTGAGEACEGTIALDAPRAVGTSDRIALAWQGPSFSSFSVSIRRAAGQAFEPIDATVSGQSAQFSRGAAYRWDSPTARVRVRGCDGAGQCVDSNEQPLLDALLGSVVEFASPNAGGQDNFGSAVTLSGDGNTLAVAGAAAGIAAGPADHLHLFERDAQGGWQRRQVLAAAACTGFVAGTATLDGTGATLAVSSAPASDCPAQAGAIEVFARAGGQWQRAARIADEAPPVDQRFSVLSLARDGRMLAATVFNNAVPWSGRARVYGRDDMGRWTLAAALAPEASNGLRAAFSAPRLSGNGAVLAITGAREITNPADPTAPAQPDSFVALFTRDATSGWIARTTVRSTKPQDCCALAQDNDQFGVSLALDDDGSTLAVGAPGDNSDASDTVGDPNNFGRRDSGAVWIFRRTGEAVWSRQAFVKAPAGTGVDFFGTSVALDRGGSVLAATALGQSLPAGVNRNQVADRAAVIEPSDQGGSSFGGAAYVFARDSDGRWTQQTTVIPPLEPRTRKTLFDTFSMAFAADATALVLGVQANTQDGMPVATSVFVY